MKRIDIALKKRSAFTNNCDATVQANCKTSTESFHGDISNPNDLSYADVLRASSLKETCNFTSKSSLKECYISQNLATQSSLKEPYNSQMLNMDTGKSVSAKNSIISHSFFVSPLRTGDIAAKKSLLSCKPVLFTHSTNTTKKLSQKELYQYK